MVRSGWVWNRRSQTLASTALESLPDLTSSSSDLGSLASSQRTLSTGPAALAVVSVRVSCGALAGCAAASEVLFCEHPVRPSRSKRPSTEAVVRDLGILVLRERDIRFLR